MMDRGTLGSREVMDRMTRDMGGEVEEEEDVEDVVMATEVGGEGVMIRLS